MALDVVGHSVATDVLGRRGVVHVGVLGVPLFVKEVLFLALVNDFLLGVVLTTLAEERIATITAIDVHDIETIHSWSYLSSP